MTTVSVKYTYQDLLTTPDDRNRYEIFEGNLIATPSPNEAHQSASMNLSLLLGSHIKRYNLGKIYTAPFDVCFDNETVIEPDLLFVSKERLSIVERQRVNGAPDLIIELLSPKAEDRDRGFKFRRCAQEGVKEFWLVDPEKQVIEIYTLTAKGYELHGKYSGAQSVKSTMLSGLEFPANEVWK